MSERPACEQSSSQNCQVSAVMLLVSCPKCVPGGTGLRCLFHVVVANGSKK